MRTKFFHKITAILMALLVMSSTLSYSFAKHYCGEHLVDVTLFGQANGCGMDMDEGLSDNSCCKDVVDLVEGQDELSLEKTVELTIEQKQFLLAFVYVVAQLELYEQKEKPEYAFYDPPELVCDFQQLHEVYLI